MAFGLLTKVLGDYNEKELKKLWPVVDEINDLEPEISALSDEELGAKTEEFRERLAEGEELEDILPEAFAVVREASSRRLGMRHFDVQLLGGMALHQGKIAEMKTGEGKTLVATLPIYLNAMEGRGVHLVTVNDYLAKRDVQWMGAIYHSLGLSIGVLQHESAYRYNPEANLENASLRYLEPVTRREAYAADITYGTNNEFGFDYLRDNMVTDFELSVQRQQHPHNYAIVDEVDNILIDEARTPLIISGQADETEEDYRRFARIVSRLREDADYVIDHRHRTVSLTDSGSTKVEQALNIKNIYDTQNFRLTRFLDAALKAHALYQRDKDYVVRDGEVIIVDEFTGRLMQGRRWSDGLHQAVEAKEGVSIQRESVTYATITLQNYFRLYEKLAGMTGTAWTEREEFNTIYDLDVLVIPTHRDMVREDEPDAIYRNEEAKFRAVVREIEEMHAAGRPVLVGTVSIEKSEYLADLLKRTSKCENPDCGDYFRVCPLKEPEVLNAKHHEREAQIVAQAGRFGAVTIATNMAGRGTDIILGGNSERLAEELAQRRGHNLVTLPHDEAEAIRHEAHEIWEKEHAKVVEAGGLHVIGTERHESRRIDNQLRGRSGRQGDKGSSRFFVSFHDDVMKRFAPEWMPSLLARLGMDEDTPLESGMVSKAIEQAQTKVEGYNFDIRKHVVEYDDVMNRQRDLDYSERRKILEGADLKANVQEMIEEALTELVDNFLSDTPMEEWNVEGFLNEVKAIVPLPDGFTAAHVQQQLPDEVLDQLLEHATTLYEAKEQSLGSETMRALERILMLTTMDRLWVHHLTALDEMRQGAGLSGYGGQDPLVVYKSEAHDMWQQLMSYIRESMVHSIYYATLTQTPVPAPAPANVREIGPDELGEQAGSGTAAPARARAAGGSAATATAPAAAAAPAGNVRKVGRNDLCPCGSGKKYKRCHGQAA
ncbi:MAG TPA: preprotein translocase subunit SecA [Dehalococcoidia bacterium]|nr:preprotein translocase subunit SecA [Dehalococcoidia bacterium]